MRESNLNKIKFGNNDPLNSSSLNLMYSIRKPPKYREEFGKMNSNTRDIKNNNNNNMTGSSDKLKDFTKKFYTDFSMDYNNYILFSNDEYIEITRNIAFLTTDTVYFNIISNLAKEESYMNINLNTVLNYIFSMLNYEDKYCHRYELANHFLMTLMIQANKIIVTTHKKNILDFYFTNDFFNMTEKCLKQWKIILQKFAYSELLDDFLYK